MVSVTVTTDHACITGVKAAVIIYHSESKSYVSIINGTENVLREPDANISSFIHRSPTGAFGKSNVPVTLKWSGSFDHTTEKLKE